MEAVTDRSSARAGKILSGIGALILLGTALFHATGYPGVSAAADAAGLRPFLAAGVKGLWLDFSVHLILVSVIVLVAGIKLGSRLTVLLCGLFPVADALILIHFVGIFAGTLLVAAAAVFIIAGGILLPRPARGVRGSYQEFR